MDKVAGSWNDEFYTPEYAIKPILKYINGNDINSIKTGVINIWCPFDTEDSNFVKVFKKNGYNVICTHIEDWKDFFKVKEEWLKANKINYIISNPPYSLKWEVLQKLFDLWIPFAMLIGVVWLFESQKRFEMFRDNEFEIMYMNRRVAYFKDFSEQKPSLNPPFSSVYLCSGVLPEKIIFEDIIKK